VVRFGSHIFLYPNSSYAVLYGSSDMIGLGNNFSEGYVCLVKVTRIYNASYFTSATSQVHAEQFFTGIKWRPPHAREDFVKCSGFLYRQEAIAY
jgi:hypothetical protein